MRFVIEKNHETAHLLTVRGTRLGLDAMFVQVVFREGAPIVPIEIVKLENGLDLLFDGINAKGLRTVCHLIPQSPEIQAMTAFLWSKGPQGAEIFLVNPKALTRLDDLGGRFISGDAP